MSSSNADARSPSPQGAFAFFFAVFLICCVYLYAAFTIHAAILTGAIDGSGRFSDPIPHWLKFVVYPILPLVFANFAVSALGWWRESIPGRIFAFFALLIVVVIAAPFVTMIASLDIR